VRGSDRIEIHEDAIDRGERVLIVDDLLATGGTSWATTELISSLGGEVVGLGFIIELTSLNGRERLSGYSVESLITC
jgi:adenine phosphoribosyltransferase